MADKLKVYKIEDSQTGKVYEIEGPEGATDDELYAFLEQDLSANTPAPAPAKPKGAAVMGQGKSDLPAAYVAPAEANIEGVQAKGLNNAPDVDWLGQDERTKIASMMANSDMSFEDINQYVKDVAVSKGYPGSGLTLDQAGLDKYRQSIKKGAPVQDVTYTNWTNTLPKPEATVGEGDGGFIDSVKRGYQEQTMYGLPGYLAEVYHDWTGTGEDALRKRFPDATPDQIEAMQEELISWTMKGVREANAAATENDNIVGKLIGGIPASAGIEDLIPVAGKGASIARRAMENAALEGVSDLAWQGADIYRGSQDEFNVTQALAAPVMGGAFGAGIAGAGKVVDKVASKFEKAPAVTPPAERVALNEYLNTQSLPPKTGEMRKRNEAQKNLRGDAVKEANEFVGDVMKTWTNAPDFEVVPSWVAIKDKGFRDTLLPDAVGAYGPDGKLYINLKNVEDASHLTSVVFHEALGHHGLAQRFTDDLDGLLDTLYDQGVDSFKKKVDDWKTAYPDVYADLDLPTQHRRAVEEVLADMSADGALPVTIRDRVSNFIKEWARAVGLNLKISEREVRSILAMAHNATINGNHGNVALNGFRYMYAGTQGRWSDRGYDALLNAVEKDRQNSGVDTRSEYSWFKGPDGKWRVEIDDSKVTTKAPDYEAIAESGDYGPWWYEAASTGDLLTDMAQKTFTDLAGDTFKLGDIIDHPTLFSVYPSLRDIRVSRPQHSTYLGEYDPRNNSIKVSAFNDRPLSTLLHEVQHAIQEIEGWPRGGGTSASNLYKMDPTKIVNGAKKYLDFLRPGVEQLRKQHQQIRMIREDPDVRKWWGLKMEDQAYSNQREQLRKELGDNYLDNPIYKKVMEEHSKVFKKYMEFEKEFLRRNDMDPDNLTTEQKDWLRDIKWDYVNDRGMGQYKQNETLKAFNEAFERYEKIEELIKITDGPYEKWKDSALTDLVNELSRDRMVIFETYQHLFGEVEARDVQHRQMLNEEERKATAPYSIEESIDPENYIFIDRPSTRPAQEVVPIHKRVEEIVNDEAKYWGITNIEKALTERDFRADVRGRLAQMGLPQDAINLDPRIQKKLGPKFSMKRRVSRGRDERAEVSAAKDILDSVLQGYQPITRSWAEAEQEARLAGLTSKQIRSAKGVGELDKRLFMYEKVADTLNEKLTNLHAKMDSDGFSMATKHKYLQTLAEFVELNGVIFRDQGEVGRALNAIKALQYTKNKLNALNEVLSQMQGNGFANFADDDAFRAFADQMKFMMNSGNTNGVAAMAKSILKPYWWQYLLSFRHSMMLSGLGTHAKNATDNALMIARELEEAAIAAPGFVIRKGLQKAGFNVKDGVSPEEFAGRLYGLIRAGLDASTYKDTLEAFKSGRGNTVYSAKTEVADARIPVISHIQDALHAADTFFRAFHNNTNLYAAGIRRAHDEGLSGIDAFQEGSNLATTPDEDLLKQARGMTDIALLVDRPSWAANKLEALKAIRPGMKPTEQAGAFVANLLFPFFRVTDRLLHQKLRRSPLALIDRVTREDLAAGGARMDVALGRMAYGSLLIWYYWDQAGQGNITGSQLEDYNKQRALEAGGYMSNAVKQGNRYVDASALNLSLLPQDLQNSVAANISSIRRAYDEGASEDDTAKALKLATKALLKELASQSFAENLSTYVDPIKANNEATFDSAMGNVIGGMASSFIPAAMRQANAMYFDPIKRDTTGDKSITDRAMGRVVSGIPGLSETLPAKRSVYGDEQPQGRSFLSMDNYRDIKTDAVSVELQRLEKTTKKAVVMGAPSSFEEEGEKYKLNAKERNEWERIQGGYLKEFVKDLISDPEWANLSDEEKVEEIKLARKDAYDYTKEDLLPYLTPSND